MTIEEAMVAKLLANTTLSGYISTRIYPVYLPQDVILPAVTYEHIAKPEHHDIDVAYPTYQFSIFALSYALARLIEAEIYTSFQREKGSWSGIRVIQGVYIDGRDLSNPEAAADTTKVFGRAIDYKIIYRTK